MVVHLQVAVTMAQTCIFVEELIALPLAVRVWFLGGMEFLMLLNSFLRCVLQ